MDPNMDPRVLLGITLVELGITTIGKLAAIWKAHGATDADLDVIIAAVDERVARRAALLPPPA